MEINLIPVIGLVPVVIGSVAALRGGLKIPKRFAPLLAIALGVVGIGIVDHFTGMNIIVGIVTGLASSGLWSGARATAGV